ncbi:hypothetical protein QBC32DRAFT_7872, partial [Pseudoneurospora amorphoporcata]
YPSPPNRPRASRWRQLQALLAVVPLVPLIILSFSAIQKTTIHSPPWSLTPATATAKNPPMSKSNKKTRRTRMRRKITAANLQGRSSLMTPTSRPPTCPPSLIRPRPRPWLTPSKSCATRIRKPLTLSSKM